MAHKAIVNVAGQELKALEFLVGFKQAYDSEGKPASGVMLGDFYLIFEGGTDLFFEWLVDAKRLENGSIKTYRDDQDSVFLSYDFENAFVTDVSESFYENVGGIQNQFNQVSSAEDLSEDLVEFGYQHDRLSKKDSAIQLNMWKRVRKFQERAKMPYCLFITMSCEKITLYDATYDNKWGK